MSGQEGRTGEIVYISGAITGTEGYAEHFQKAQKWLEERGYRVINPAEVMSSIAGVLGYEDLMELDMVLLRKVDTLYLLRGWERSRGANREYGFALGAGKRIRKEEEEYERG